MKRHLSSIGAGSLILMLGCAPAQAWWPQGHSTVTAAALQALPDDAPAFLRHDTGLAAHCAQDPDVAKNPAASLVSDREAPDHFIDYELLKGKPLPPTRNEYIWLCVRSRADPKNVGYVPYAVGEWTERLTIALAEYRKWPDDPAIQAKCLVYAGFLSHYGADMCMPLHTTIHHDGRADAKGRSPRTGIHAKVDSLIEKLALQPADLAKGQRIEPLEKLLPGILQELERSRALIDRTYQLESQLPPTDDAANAAAGALGAAWKPSPEITAFTTERAREATRFVAALYLTAWRNSAAIKLPAWLKR